MRYRTLCALQNPLCVETPFSAELSGGLRAPAQRGQTGRARALGMGGGGTPGAYKALRHNFTRLYRGRMARIIAEVLWQERPLSAHSA